MHMYNRNVPESTAKSKFLTRILFPSSLLGVDVDLDTPQRDKLLIFQLVHVAYFLGLLYTCDVRCKLI